MQSDLVNLAVIEQSKSMLKRFGDYRLAKFYQMTILNNLTLTEMIILQSMIIVPLIITLKYFFTQNTSPAKQLKK